MHTSKADRIQIKNNKKSKWIPLWKYIIINDASFRQLTAIFLKMRCSQQQFAVYLVLFPLSVNDSFISEFQLHSESIVWLNRAQRTKSMLKSPLSNENSYGIIMLSNLLNVWIIVIFWPFGNENWRDSSSSSYCHHQEEKSWELESSKWNNEKTKIYQKWQWPKQTKIDTSTWKECSKNLIGNHVQITDPSICVDCILHFIS